MGASKMKGKKKFSKADVNAYFSAKPIFFIYVFHHREKMSQKHQTTPLKQPQHQKQDFHWNWSLNAFSWALDRLFKLPHFTLFLLVGIFFFGRFVCLFFRFIIIFSPVYVRWSADVLYLLACKGIFSFTKVKLSSCGLKTSPHNHTFTAMFDRSY